MSLSAIMLVIAMYESGNFRIDTSNFHLLKKGLEHLFAFHILAGFKVKTGEVVFG
jgi:hypothetical protein